jgi:hypothetical protein
MERWERELAEIRAIMAETAKKDAEARAEADRRAAEADKRAAEADKRAAEARAETDRRAAEAKAEADRRAAEADKRAAEAKVEADRRAAEADKCAAEAKEKIANLQKMSEDMFKGLAELRAETRGIGESNGKFSETYFYNALFDSMSFGGINFDQVDKGLKRAQRTPEGTKVVGEYDVVMYNGDAIALIEVKYRVRKEHVTNLVDKQISNFKRLFPQYAGHNYYLGIAGLSFEENVEAEALSRGIGILRPKGENVEILDQNLKAY